MMFAIIPNLTRKNAAQVTRLICAKLDELGAAYSLPLSTENVFSDTKAEFLPEKELLGGCEATIMYEFRGFTQKANKALNLSIESAQNFGHDYIGTEHILLGLIKEGSGVAAAALEYWGVTAEAL